MGGPEGSSHEAARVPVVGCALPVHLSTVQWTFMHAYDQVTLL